MSEREVESVVNRAIVAGGSLLYKVSKPLYLAVYGVYKRLSERDELAYIRGNVSPGSVVCDIGANVGLYTAELSKLAGADGVVHAFEPDPGNCALLRRRTARLNNVRTHECAVGRKSGTASLFVSDELCVDHRMYACVEPRRTVDVQCVCLDDFLKDEPRLDFVKMDVQGFEYEVLQGMRTVLSRNPQIRMVMELWPYGLKQAGASAAALLEFLAGLGFGGEILHRGGAAPVDQYARRWNESDEMSYYTLVVKRR